MIINQSGLVIRLAVDNVRVAGRNTQGVKLISLKGNDTIASIARVQAEEEEEGEELDENGEEGQENTSTDEAVE